MEDGKFDTADDPERPAPHPPRKTARSDFGERLGYGILPVAIATALLYVAELPGYTALVRWSALALAAAALGLGRHWIAGTRITRWAGIYLAIFTVFAAALGAFGFNVGFSWAILPLVALAALGALGDLFIAQPYKGRFARARAERRGLPE
jgi:hypothetical protein